MSTLTAVCDLAICPVSYDFVVWLARAMLEQQRLGAEKLHVELLPHEIGLGGFSRDWGGHSEAQARWRLWHIVIASCPLAPATVTLRPVRYESTFDPLWRPSGAAHHAGALIEAARAGETIPQLRATDQAREYVARWLGVDKFATITLRQSQRDPGRNSDQAAWGAFALELAAQGYRVVTLFDSEVALSCGEGYAAHDPDLRLALYERAAVNFLPTNGPAALAWFSSAPFIQFGCGEPAATWRGHWKKYMALDPGDQLPWGRKDQRLVWTPDTAEAIREEYEAWASATS